MFGPGPAKTFRLWQRFTQSFSGHVEWIIVFHEIRVEGRRVDGQGDQRQGQGGQPGGEPDILSRLELYSLVVGLQGGLEQPLPAGNRPVRAAGPGRRRRLRADAGFAAGRP